MFLESAVQLQYRAINYWEDALRNFYRFVRKWDECVDQKNGIDCVEGQSQILSTKFYFANFTYAQDARGRRELRVVKLFVSKLAIS